MFLLYNMGCVIACLATSVPTMEAVYTCFHAKNKTTQQFVLFKLDYNDFDHQRIWTKRRHRWCIVSTFFFYSFIFHISF